MGAAWYSKSPHVVGVSRTLLARTCTRCGHFKQGDEFKVMWLSTHKNRNKSWARHPWCRPCVLNVTEAATKKANHKSWDKAYNHRQHWTCDELDHLYVLHRVGYSGEVIAETLGRSIAAVRQAYHKHFSGEVD